MEFVQGIVLFSNEASKNGSWTAEDDHLARIFEVLGPFPPHFIEKGNRTAHFFDGKGIIFYQSRSYPIVILCGLVPGNLLRIPNLKPTNLERLINDKAKPFLNSSDIPDAEVPIFIDFLKRHA